MPGLAGMQAKCTIIYELSLTSETDEREPLLPNSTPPSVAVHPIEQTTKPSPKRPLWLKLLNPRLTRRPWRIFEILDFRLCVLEFWSPVPC